jgi:hypothetical protein
VGGGGGGGGGAAHARCGWGGPGGGCGCTGRLGGRTASLPLSRLSILPNPLHPSLSTALTPRERAARRRNLVDAAGWTAIADALEAVTSLTSLNGCALYAGIRAGGQRELYLGGTELGVAVARYLPRSADTLKTLDLRCCYRSLPTLSHATARTHTSTGPGCSLNRPRSRLLTHQCRRRRACADRDTAVKPIPTYSRPYFKSTLLRAGPSRELGPGRP